MKRALPRILTLLGLLLFALLLYFLFRSSGFLSLDEEGFRAAIAACGVWAPLAFVLATFLQVTFIPIPSTVTVLGGSYLFGALPSFFYSYLGLLLGSVVAFWLGRLFGLRLVYWLAGGRERVDALLLRARDKELVVLFFMFLFPAFPDDLLCLLAGLLPISFPAFLLMQLLTRATSVGATLLFFSGEVIPFSGWGIPVIAAVVLLALALFLLSLRYAAPLARAFDRMTAAISRRFSRKKEDGHEDP